MAREAEVRLLGQLSRLRSLPLLRGARLSGELERLQKQLERIVDEPSDEEIWRSVELARNPDRPYALDYVERLLEDWFELHGDRAHGDDAAVVAGLGRFRGRTVVLIGNQKGRDVKERTKRNFGMAYPEGYGKAMRARPRRRPPRSSRTPATASSSAWSTPSSPSRRTARRPISTRPRGCSATRWPSRWRCWTESAARSCGGNDVCVSAQSARSPRLP